jgi:cell division protein ZapA
MEKLSIRIKIADREYPMKVEPDEESTLRNAGKRINEMIAAYKEAFNIDDKQDLLAMVAFDCLVEKTKALKDYEGQANANADKLVFLNKLITDI